MNWDFALAEAYQTIDDLKDQYGLFPWELDDDRVEVNANKRVHKFEQARDNATAGSKNKPYKPVAGEYFVPDKVFRGRSGDHIQTYGEWVIAQSESDNN